MSDRVSILRTSLRRRRAVVVPGCHDALSARIVEDAGFEAAQVSGFGLAGSLLAKPEVKLPVEGSIAFVCGPPVMFRFAIRDLLALGFQGKDIVSTLERYMKCGVGKCGHCCIGQAYVCTDGPVFTYEQIAQLGESI